MIELHGFHHEAITVKNCDAGAAWYASVLGVALAVFWDRP